MDQELMQQIKSCVIEVANRLKNPEYIVQVIEQEIGTVEQKKAYWQPLSLSQGYPGICVLLGALDTVEPDAGWDQIGHAYAIEIQRGLGFQAVGTTGLWTGLTGISLGISSLSRGKKRYQNMLEKLHHGLADMTAATIMDLSHMFKDQLHAYHYDTISGVAGVARYFLLNQDESRFQELLPSLLEYLTKVLSEVIGKGQNLSKWLIKPESYLNPELRQTYPDGYFDLGMSHGISGVLAALSIACQTSSQQNPAQLVAIRNVGEWILQQVQLDEYGLYWPGKIGLKQKQPGNIQMISLSSGRESWCYGTHGIARAFWLAGIATGEKAWCESAIQATIAANIRTFNQDFYKVSPTFCHGLAGLLHATNELAQETGHPVLTLQRDQLAKNIISRFDPSLPFCFYDLDAFDMTVRPTQKAGLLDGAAGVAFALLSCLGENESPGNTAFMLR